jgi:hypothetical protein
MRSAPFVAVVVCGDLIGNVFLRTGMRSYLAMPGLSAMDYLQVLLNLWVAGGILCCRS